MPEPVDDKADRNAIGNLICSIGHVISRAMEPEDRDVKPVDLMRSSLVVQRQRGTDRLVPKRRVRENEREG